ncbi:MAG TPA: DUF2207 domain-containing protein [Actinomycetota bacterium]|nr:DUF2207 domain-containing protein [Actinomycetota bacterium]
MTGRRARDARVARATIVAAGALLLLLLGLGRPAVGQGFVSESTPRYDVDITIEPSGSIVVTETIVQDFGSTERHGIERFVPERLRYDDTYDRVYPIDVVSVETTANTPDDLLVEHSGGSLRIRIGDPDRTITGPHTYTITYRVEGAMNGFSTHDELYWNAIGTEWQQAIDRADVRVSGPARVTRVACYAGLAGSTAGCERAEIEDGAAVFSHRTLPAFNGMSVAVALPPGTVASTAPILVERWSLDRAFERTPLTIGGSAALTAAVLGGVGVLAWRRGRDRRYQGSQVDQVMGNAGGPEQSVPLFERGDAPVEFAPPEDLRPGQIGTLIDERANTLDVTATIVDLATRHYLVIEEIEKRGWFGKADWKLIRQPAPGDELLTYERMLLDRLFGLGDEVKLSELKNTFASKLKEVEESLYADALRRKWFLRRPDRVRAAWVGVGLAALVVAGGLAFVLVRWTHAALLSIPLVVGAIALLAVARWMPRRTARGTALARRIAGFRRVIETAETHMSRWAEEENVFTRYLPYAIVFGLTEKWAEAFEGLASAPTTDTSWYVSSRPFVYSSFGDRMDGFAVTTTGMIASTPAGSGGSGLGGGGFSGGGGGGGGGGSW